PRRPSTAPAERLPAPPVFTHQDVLVPPGAGWDTDRPGAEGAVMTQLEDLVARVETWKALDRVAEPLARAVGRAVRPTPVRNVLIGTVIGHPLHPLLTDVPIGAWTMAAVLDLAGGLRTARAADVLVAAGLAAA